MFLAGASCPYEGHKSLNRLDIRVRFLSIYCYCYCYYHYYYCYCFFAAFRLVLTSPKNFFSLNDFVDKKGYYKSAGSYFVKLSPLNKCTQSGSLVHGRNF